MDNIILSVAKSYINESLAIAATNAQKDIDELNTIMNSKISTVEEKIVELIPTKTSQLQNDSGFKTTDTTYSDFVKSGSGAKAGLVPAPSTTAGTTKYLCEDGTWQVPPDTNTQTITGVKGNVESSYRTGNVNLTPANIGAVAKSGDTITGTLTSSKTTSTYLAGNQGQAIINSTAGAGGYTMLDKLNSTNGYFTDGVYQNKRLLQYTAKSTVDAGTNSVTKSVTLLDESGNSSFPGTVTASKFNGTANNGVTYSDSEPSGLTVGATWIGN